MDGALPGQPRMTLPGRIDALGSAASRHASWAEAAETSRCLGLALIVRGLQPSHLVLVASCRGPMWLPIVCGVMGAGGVVAGCDGEAPINDCSPTGARPSQGTISTTPAVVSPRQPSPCWSRRCASGIEAEEPCVG